MHFKTYSGARKRAEFEMAYNKRFVWRVIANTNTHQAAQGYVWRLKKEKRTAKPLQDSDPYGMAEERRRHP